MAIYAIQDIKQDEEILVSYNYGLTNAPVWYKNLWLQYLRYELQVNFVRLISFY